MTAPDAGHHRRGLAAVIAALATVAGLLLMANPAAAAGAGTAVTTRGTAPAAVAASVRPPAEVTLKRDPGLAAKPEISQQPARPAAATPAKVSVSAGGDGATCGVRANGTMACWGSNDYGQATPPGGMFSSVSMADTFPSACALRTDATIDCWGLFSNDGDSSPAGTFTSVSVGPAYACGLATDGHIACWGAVQPGASPPAGTFTDVAVGGPLNYYGCAVRTDGTLACWGSGTGEPPAGTFRSVSVGVVAACAVRADGTLACWGLEDSPGPTPPDGTFSSVSVGYRWPCAVRTDGALACWDWGSGNPPTPPDGTFSSVSVGSSSGASLKPYACAVRADATIACWGSDNAGQLGAVPSAPAPAPANGSLGAQYSQKFVPSGTPPGDTYTVNGGALPPGLALSTTGTLSGWPDTLGTYTFTITASDGLFPDASASFTVTIGAQVADVGCMRRATPPDPPPGGAVLAGPLNPDGSVPNVVRLLNGAQWHPGDCGAGGTDVVAHPTTVTVAPGAALVLEDAGSDGITRYSAWGAVNVTPADPAPAWAPGAAGWTTTAVDDMDAAKALGSYDSCRDCVITNAQLPPLLAPNKPTFYVADLSGANLSGDRLSGYMEGYNFTGTNLTGATLDADLSYATLSRTIVNSTVFGSSSLLGTQLADLQHAATTPPSFDGVEIGMAPTGAKCTTFSDTNLAGAVLAPARVVAGCKSSPLLPGSTASPSVVKQVMAATNARGNVDLGDATYLSDSSDRSSLAGADLQGVILDHAAFTGDPADFTGTDFDDASLVSTNFTLADFTGATFRDATATRASFREADLAALGTTPGASFSSQAAGAQTNLTDADFADADISGAQFVGANLTSAVFSHVLAVDTNFNAVTAADTDFTGAHIYGSGQAFHGATDLTGAAFNQAVLAGDTGTGTGFNLTGTDLSNATFSGAQCIHCDFTNSTLTGVKFDDAYLPGAVFSGATLKDANFDDAWLYCGDLSNSRCAAAGPSEWSWPLALGSDLGSDEVYGPVPFPDTDLTGVSLDDVAACPSGKAGGTTPIGCSQGDLLPDEDQAPTLPPACSAAALEACLTPTSTLTGAALAAEPISLTPVVAPTWSTTLDGSGYYVGLADGTIRRVGTSTSTIVAGRPGQHCTPATAACGDGGPATSALLGTPSGLAVGLDGSLYVADSSTHRVRKIDPSGTITTIAGTGTACTATAIPACGDSGPATAAALNGPYGVWADPRGDVFIADGTQGVREVALDGTITEVSSGLAGYDVTSVAGDTAGDLYLTTDGPDYLLKIDLATGTVTKVVGTGTSGYNGGTDQYGNFLPGTQVQVNDPRSISIAADGDVVFADAGNSLIRAYVPASGAVIDLAGLVSDSGVPESGYNGDGNAASQTELNHPLSVTVTSGALMVVADTGNSRVRQIGPNPLAPSS